ncbi:hypothetical protein SAMN05428997_1034 [Bosea sp. CRIB-10]|uniref:hypothetical protein n=1 Tax=Bosea sp. CRIB-10 TaxID=378404 RepID=UPI0008EC537A|nr:hypothetical protein [Bosea sp. CRIB-10]SFB92328.1 hypothetical protein SAMN05428997_1034 [Bosea sp. CRIB-10]
MAKTYKAPFTQAAKLSSCICTAAKTTYNDAANAVLLFTAGADGARVSRVWAIPRATVTATQLQLYVSYDAGVTLHLIETALMAAYTMAQTTQAPATDFVRATAANPLRLPANARLYAAIGVALAGGIVFSADAEDF